MADAAPAKSSDTLPDAAAGWISAKGRWVADAAPAKSSDTLPDAAASKVVAGGAMLSVRPIAVRLADGILTPSPNAAAIER